MNNYPPQFNGNTYGTTTQSTVYTSSVSSVMKQVYVRMTLALVVTAFVSLFCANSLGYMLFIAQNSWAMWGLVLVELGLVIGISAGINKLSSTTATILFFLFAVVNGMMLAPIFIVYTGVSIAKTFFITAGTFGVMAAYGYFTSRDLTKIGGLLFMALIGVIIASVVNMFLHSSGLDLVVSIIGVLVFVGLTAWDSQQIKMSLAMAPDLGETSQKLAVTGALSLYLDFINLFLYLLRFFGGNRD